MGLEALTATTPGSNVRIACGQETIASFQVKDCFKTSKEYRFEVEIYIIIDLSFDLALRQAWRRAYHPKFDLEKNEVSGSLPSGGS